MSRWQQMFSPAGLASLLAMCVLITALPSRATPLDLASRPLFAGNNVKPNIMVAVDDSGSMDFETLFPTDSGLLYWSDSTHSAWRNGGYVRDSNIGYAYLFPNGYNHCSGRNCTYKDRRIYSKYKAIPPTPSLGFARDPEFNKAYFDPSISYTPWVGKSQSDPAAAYYDPQIRSGKMNLTVDRESTRSGEKFSFRADMVIPTGTKYYHTTTNSQGGGGSKTGFYAEPSDYKVPSSSQIAVSYFPATFYLKQSTALPAGFGWKPGATKIIGKGPNGEPLYGYEIRPANFTSTAAYTAAINNFANWFTYYRKRQLASRGGIAAAFNQISNARVGTCTINHRHTLTMRNMDNASDRQAFFNYIFDLNFSSALGTPNRRALAFLGNQLQTNRSIITSPCQQNFAILFTDGYNTGTAGSNVGNADGGADPPFADNYANTIADVAMHYYKNLGRLANTHIARDQMPLPAGCEKTSPDPSLDCEKDLHMVTFGVTLDQQGIIFNNPNYSAQNRNPYQNPPDWPNPNTGAYGIEQIDDLWHATINSRGELLNANTPEAIADAFGAALQNIVNRRGSASALATNSSSLTTDTVVYRASFAGGIWAGELAAYALAGNLASDQPIWKASAALGQNPAQRVILTDLPATSDGKLTPSVFTYNALQSSARKNQLSKAQVGYLRGERTNERSHTGSMRDRGTDILGDIVHSSPAYVGAPDRYRYPVIWQDLRHPSASMPENNGAPYYDPTNANAFAQKHANRTPMVYVGANDGMLHGFDAHDGTEKLAYVPNAVIPNLPALTDPNYIHQYYVDGSPATGDAFFDGAWHTVLVGGLGDGGRSIYALDITAPDNFSQSAPASTVLWEYTDDQLGKTFGKPSIVRLHNGQWAAMVSNGYNSDDEGASLYLINIQTGKLIRRIDTGAAPANTGEAPGNGLSTPFPADLDGDFITDYTYAGDLYGNLWKFDLTSTNPADWSASRLFRATDVNGNPQPVTTQPQVGVQPYGSDYGVMVYFGTGKYLENGDAALDTAVRNSFYGIWDLNVFTFNEARDGRPLFSTSLKTDIPRSRLTRQTVTQESSQNGQTYRVVSDNPVDYQRAGDSSSSSGGDRRGWVLDLPEGTGELIVTDPRIQGQTVSFSTTIPNDQPCKAGGTGFFMALNATTGGRTNFPVFDLDGDHQFNSSDTVTIDGQPVAVSGISISGGSPGAANYSRDRKHQDNLVTLPNSNGGITQINMNDGLPPDGRRSWREIRR